MESLEFLYDNENVCVHVHYCACVGRAWPETADALIMPWRAEAYMAFIMKTELIVCQNITIIIRENGLLMNLPLIP